MGELSPSRCPENSVKKSAVMPRPVALKRDAGQELLVQKWISEVLGQPDLFEDALYEEVLKSGIIICHLMNKINPGCIRKINEKGSNFKMMENISKFHEACKDYGVDEADIFQTNDLAEKRDMGSVTNTMFALGRAMQKHPEWNGPQLVKNGETIQLNTETVTKHLN